jgi:asparagine synthase (glutamine-hydrolysing)
VARYLGINEVFEPALKARLLTPEFAAEVSGSDAHEFLSSSLPADADRMSDLQKTLYLDTKYWLGDYLLLYTDKLSMANSLEARVPFLDHELFGECFKLPDKYKLNGTNKKLIFKAAMRGLVPDENIDKKKKGFLAPVNQWLRTDMNDYVHDLLMSDTCLSRGYFTREGMQHVLDLHDSGREDYGRHIFCLVLLETWFRVFIDAEPRRPGDAAQRVGEA